MTATLCPLSGYTVLYFKKTVGFERVAVSDISLKTFSAGSLQLHLKSPPALYTRYAATVTPTAKTAEKSQDFRPPAKLSERLSRCRDEHGKEGPTHLNAIKAALGPAINFCILFCIFVYNSSSQAYCIICFYIRSRQRVFQGFQDGTPLRAPPFPSRFRYQFSAHQKCSA